MKNLGTFQKSEIPILMTEILQYKWPELYKNVIFSLGTSHLGHSTLDSELFGTKLHISEPFKNSYFNYRNFVAKGTGTL